jgi:hypothetical protein
MLLLLGRCADKASLLDADAVARVRFDIVA